MQSGGGGVLVNQVANFLGGITFEIYLCHMVIYRVLEKLHLVHLFGNGLLAYIFTAVAVIFQAGRGNQHRNHQETAENVLHQHHRR